jgi:hypothetical protein
MYLRICGSHANRKSGKKYIWSANRKSANCYICGMSANLKQVKSENLRICDLLNLLADCLALLSTHR